jgi:hypothetical protein
MKIFSLSSKFFILIGFFGLVTTLHSLGQSEAEPERTLVTLQNE